MDFFASLLPPSTPRPGLSPLPGTVPLTLEAALCPPLLYYIALLLLPPVDGNPHSLVVLRSTLAALAGILFFRLPLAYHVPFSVGLTYQLALVGLYGGCRVLDAFFISPYLFGHIPRRVTYSHEPRAETPAVAASSSARAIDPANPDTSYFDTVFDTVTQRPKSHPVTQLARTEDGWPHSAVDRASWALELELSMRGVGFTWTTADVRHTRKTWLPSVADRLHSIAIHCVPVIGVSLAWLRWVYTTHLHGGGDDNSIPDSTASFDALPLAHQLATTAALGAFLMAAFSAGHSAGAILLHPLRPHPLAFFPALYSTRVWNVRSVRAFWSFGWHRLFARLFLVYGVWPGEWAERALMGKRAGERADVGKVVGGFLSSAFVHSFAVRTVIGVAEGDAWGGWREASGEAWFFAENGLAVVLEEGVRRMVQQWRKRSGGGGDGKSLERWYDGVVGRIWWVSVLLFSGRNFARGWVRAGLVREMSGL